MIFRSWYIGEKGPKSGSELGPKIYCAVFFNLAQWIFLIFSKPIEPNTGYIYAESAFLTDFRFLTFWSKSAKNWRFWIFLKIRFLVLCKETLFLFYPDLPVGFMSGFEFLSSAGLILFNLISLVCLVCLLCLVCPRSISFSVLALLVRDRPLRSISLPFSVGFHFSFFISRQILRSVCPFISPSWVNKYRHVIYGSTQNLSENTFKVVRSQSGHVVGHN